MINAASTPVKWALLEDLTFCTADILHKTDGRVLDRLTDSDLKPMKLVINMEYAPQQQQLWK